MRSTGELKIPRCVKPAHISNVNVELHMFSDASEVEYGVVGYCRWHIEPEKFARMMIYAKSRVVPLKSVTVPRPELNTVRLAARVAEELRNEAGFSFTRTIYWTDSTIVLHYIRNTATRYSTFVANRISPIHKLSSPGDWRHFTSENNPARLASRGVGSVAALRYWFKGPSFLGVCEVQWPHYELNVIPEGIELKTKHALVNVTTSASEPTG
ncbi:hypothetical protein CRM22_008615 [Opisthorchis felineus]|uniref:Uncharacterized protein n=1 Tax=Opisthorchis felineus TaxID=147828 RepID=A0A4S2LAE2_OPIFE|nr:hypothetical protein CRM22_008615 [Opisthorchis felineus]